MRFPCEFCDDQFISCEMCAEASGLFWFLDRFFSSGWCFVPTSCNLLICMRLYHLLWNIVWRSPRNMFQRAVAWLIFWSARIRFERKSTCWKSTTKENIWNKDLKLYTHKQEPSNVAQETPRAPHAFYVEIKWVVGKYSGKHAVLRRKPSTFFQKPVRP